VLSDEQRFVGDVLELDDEHKVKVVNIDDEKKVELHIRDVGPEV